MTRLATLRSRLEALRWSRAAVRWGCAASALVAAAILLWAGAFLLDWTIRWSWGARVVVLLAWSAALVALLRRWAWPLLAATESLEQVALIVEREHRIDSDLIAALQFEQGGAAAWGSPRLTTAVVEYVAEFSPGLDVFAGFRWRPLPRYAAAAGAALLALLIGLFAFPEHAAAFWNRFWLGGAHYPTRTKLVELKINGQDVPPFHSTPVRLRLTQNEPIHLTVRCDGEIPPEGTVEIRARSSGAWSAWRLTQPASATEFVADAAHLVDTSRIWIRLGDAVSDPIDLTVLALPIVDVQWSATAPAYAVGAEAPEIPPGARQFSVLQGSRVALRLECLNKALSQVRLHAGGQAFDLRTRRDGPHLYWESPPGTPLDGLREPLSFELQVADEDGLAPDPPIQGQIRLRTDRQPRVAAAIVTRKVLPGAKPRITYGAADDFGLRRVRLVVEVVRGDGSKRPDDLPIWRRAADVAPQTTVRGEAVLDLSAYELQKGDEVRVVVEAEDDRGDLEPQIGRSEPLVFDVTDRNGILAGLLESDQQSAKQLDAIIQRELGIGGSKR